MAAGGRDRTSFGTIIGRSPELRTVAAFLAHQAPHDCLVVEGDAGIGKTALWSHCVDRARAQDHTVLSARPVLAEGQLGYAALRDLLAPVGSDVLDALPEVQRAALDSVLLRGGGSAPPSTSAVAVAFLSVVRIQSLAGPVLIAVDDVQWLDSSTATVLRYTARRITADPVTFVVTSRRDGTPAATFTDSIDRERRVVLHLGPLDTDELDALVRHHLGTALPRRRLAQVVEATRGNPFYALQVVRELVRRGDAPFPAVPIPDEVRTVVEQQLRRLPTRTRSALLETSMLAHPTLDVLDEASLGPALEAGIVRFAEGGRIEFSHPLFAQGVYDLVTPTRRRSLHARLAAILSDPEQVARHSALAADAPDAGVAGTLEDAARLAGARGAPLAGAELMETSLRFTPENSGGDLARRSVATGELYFFGGDLERARSALEEALARALPRRERCTAAHLLGEIAIHGDGFEDAARWLGTALDDAGDDRIARARILCSLVYAQECLGDFDGASRRAEELRACCDRPEVDPGTSAQGLAVLAMVSFLRGDGFDAEALARALELEDRDAYVVAQVRPSTIAGLLHLYTGQFDDARNVLWSVHEHLALRGATSVYLLSVLVDVERLAGDLDAAERMAELANHAAREVGGVSARLVADSFTCLLLACRGDETECRQLVERVLVESDDTSFRLAEQFARSALGILELSLGRPAEGFAALGPLVAIVEALAFGDPVMVPFLPDAVEALVAIGEIDRADRLTGRLEARAAAVDRASARALAARCRGLVAWARGDVESSLEELSRACALHEEQLVPFELARTLLVLGRVQRRSRRFRRARASFDRAHELFVGIGARLWVATVSAERDRTHVRQSTDELTPTESRIAALASEGLSNREIAERLFITPKTVEANLSRVYRKLSIRSRAALAAALARRSPVDPRPTAHDEGFPR